MTHKTTFLKKHKLDPKEQYSLKELSKIGNIPEGILQEVYNRGVGAWKNNSSSVRNKNNVNKRGGPRSKLMSKEQWGLARVYSFLNKGKTYHTTDSDLQPIKINLKGSGSGMNNEQLLESLKGYALSDLDLQHILNPDTKIHKYTDLYKIKHIDELFDSLGRCILLYLTEDQNTGHWIGLLKKGNEIEFFDPYGHPPDTQGENLNVPYENNELFGQNYPRLLELVKKGGYKLRFNNKPLQKEDYSIATCGRHTATRLLFYKLSLEQYHELMDKLENGIIDDADDVVTKLTYDILNK